MDAIGWHQRFSARFSKRYDRSPAFRERLEVWTKLIARHVRQGALVLDAGCGPGLLACRAARRAAQVIALDASANMIDAARANAAREGVVNMEFHLGLIGDETLFQGRGFDVILCSSVLEYVAELDAAVAWLAARLAPGGALIVSMPNGRSLYRLAERLSYRLTGWPRYYAFVRHSPDADSFSDALRRGGLEPLEVDYYGGPPLMRRLSLSGSDDERREALFVVVARKALD